MPISAVAATVVDELWFRRLTRTLILLLVASGTACVADDHATALSSVSGIVVDVRALGAKGDGKSNDSVAFREAAGQIEQAGSGKLVIPAGKYLVGEQVHETGKYPYYRHLPVFSVSNVDGLIIEGNGAVLRMAPGLRFGSFDKESGSEFTPKPGGFFDYDYNVGAGNILQIQGSRNVTIRDLELDGNNPELILGGYWGDTGRQCQGSGLWLYNNSNVVIENIHTHHHGLDGICIGYTGLREGDHETPHLLKNVRCEYNGRQGLSWVGGRGLTAIRCSFSHTGRSTIASAPGAGLDIEAEESVCRNGLFVDCQFTDNSGPGIVADSGDGGYSRFMNCTIWGTSNWSIWNTKPGMAFEFCRIHGSTVHGYGSEDPSLATRFMSCHFDDDEYPGRGVYRSTALIESAGGNNILFDQCEIVARGTKSFYLDGGGTREVIRNCRITHGFRAPDQDFLCLLRGCLIANTRFTEEYAADATQKWYIETENLKIGNSVILDGPRVKWQNWSWGTTGPVPSNTKTIVTVSKSTPELPRKSEGDVIELNDGRLLLVSMEFGGDGSDFATTRLVAHESSDGGFSWGQHRVITETVPGDLNVYSPNLIRAKDGGILLLFMRQHRPGSLTIHVWKSTDEGTIFSPLAECAANRDFALCNATIKRLSSGRLLLPANPPAPGKPAETGPYAATTLYSDDDGLTWQVSDSRVELPMRGAMEPHVEQTADGRVLMVMRNQLGKLYFSESKDEGVTWGPAYASPLTAPESCPELTRIPGTSDLLMIWNNSYDPKFRSHFGKRSPLTTAVSKDHGKTWQHVRDIETDPKRAFSNPGCRFTSDGRAIINYWTCEYLPNWAMQDVIDLRVAVIDKSWFYDESGHAKAKDGK